MNIEKRFKIVKLIVNAENHKANKPVRCPHTIRLNEKPEYIDYTNNNYIPSVMVVD